MLCKALCAFFAFGLALVVGKDFEQVIELKAALTSELQLGIDLGTTQSVAAICVQGNVSVVRVDGAELMPSTAWFSRGRGINVGNKATPGRLTDPGNVIYAAKRVIGLAFPASDDQSVQSGSKVGKEGRGQNRNSRQAAAEEEQAANSRAMMASLPFDFVKVREKGPWQGNIGFRLADNGRVVTPEHVGALLLKKLKAAAERSPVLDWFRRTMGFTFKSLTVSIPVTFSDEQKKATVRASKMAGFKQVRLIEEPIAAAIAFGLGRAKNTSRALVFDIGGGTLDVAILNFNAYSGTFYIETTAGQQQLGGEDFDIIVANLALSKLQDQQAAHAVNGCPKTLHELFVLAERAKRELSIQNATQICVPAAKSGGEKNLPSSCFARVSLSRKEFEQAAKPKLDAALATVQQALDEAGITNDASLDVVLVGGSSRIPIFRHELQKLLPQASLHFDGVHPDQAVAIGAAKSWGCNQ